ncbi:MAG: GNAT family N-acetyltransferase [Flavicella sp.]
MFVTQLITAEDTHAIRRRVLRDGKDVSVVFEGDTDCTTFHAGIFKGSTLLGIATFMKNKHKDLVGEQYQLRGMAVSESHQGQGLGNTLLGFGLKKVSELGGDLCWCNARTVALSFYKHMEFEIIGEEFIVPEIGPHFVMFKKLSNV